MSVSSRSIAISKAVTSMSPPATSKAIETIARQRMLAEIWMPLIPPIRWGSESVTVQPRNMPDVWCASNERY